MKKATAVFALAKDQNHADQLVRNLQGHGFRNDEISVLGSSGDGPVVHREKNADGTLKEYVEPSTHKQGAVRHEKHSKAAEGAVTGATAGGMIGGAIGLLVGAGTLAIPGIGVFLAAGPLVAALSGSAVGGALGLVVGSLVGFGIPEYEAKKFENSLKKGGVLLVVHAENSKAVDEAKDILKKGKATDISTTSEKAGMR